MKSWGADFNGKDLNSQPLLPAFRENTDLLL